jgi:hypothetical protein
MRAQRRKRWAETEADQPPADAEESGAGDEPRIDGAHGRQIEAIGEERRDEPQHCSASQHI